jgi:hypothetical protein
MVVNTNCIVCYTTLYELGHFPVKTQCACAGRVCHACAPRLTSCPWCRHPDAIDPATIDHEYLLTVCRAERTARCSGCRSRRASRTLAAHQQECIPLLASKISDLEHEKNRLVSQYEKIVVRNSTLQRDMRFALETIEFLNTMIQNRAQSSSGDVRSASPAGVATTVRNSPR